MKQETPSSSPSKARHGRPGAPILPDLSPLDILLMAMRRSWASGDEARAVELARITAPFMPPRRANPGVEKAAAAQPDQLTDAEMARLFAITEAEGEPADDDPPIPDGLVARGAAP